MPAFNKHYASVALAIAAGLAMFTGHDGWGWCVLAVILIEC